MLYSDYQYRAFAPKISNYILRFENHYAQYVNATLVRVVDYNQICLQ